MKCPQCQLDNPAQALYCGKCGAKLLAAEEASFPSTMTIRYPAKKPFGTLG